MGMCRIANEGTKSCSLFRHRLLLPETAFCLFRSSRTCRLIRLARGAAGLPKTKNYLDIPNKTFIFVTTI